MQRAEGSWQDDTIQLSKKIRKIQEGSKSHRLGREVAIYLEGNCRGVRNPA